MTNLLMEDMPIVEPFWPMYAADQAPEMNPGKSRLDRLGLTLPQRLRRIDEIVQM